MDLNGSGDMSNGSLPYPPSSLPSSPSEEDQLSRSLEEDWIVKSEHIKYMEESVLKGLFVPFPPPSISLHLTSPQTEQQSLEGVRQVGQGCGETFPGN